MTRHDAPVAQGIEQGLPKPRAGGSNPPRRIIHFLGEIDVPIQCLETCFDYAWYCYLPRLYLIPTPDYFFNPLYGNLPPWMQERLPKFEATDDGALKVNLDGVQYPEGINFHDAKTELKDIFRVHLDKLGFAEETDYEFVDPESSEFIVKFTQQKSRADLEAVLEDLHFYGSLPTVLRKLIPNNRLKLGLDLKGGVRLVLEVDPEQSKAELLKERASSIPERLRADDILCKKVDVAAEGESLKVFVLIKKKYRADAEQKATISE